MSSKLISVVTTVQEPTEGVRRLGAVLEASGGSLVVVGDQKGPARFDLEGVHFYGIQDQLKLPFSLAGLLPKGHYARKNLGYLIAVCQGADCIYETDDDNMPSSEWAPRCLNVNAQKVAPRPWLNVYRLFSTELIWPRGFPLSRIQDPATYAHEPETPLCSVDAPIQQGLADLCPDVDAVWRLVLDREFRFQRRSSVWLPAGTWCPFNSQSTWWWPVAYPLLYLPSYCSFRMTDIWRSFMAQRCVWELGMGIVFHAAEAVQQRNDHNLMRDFADEMPGYLKNEDFARELSDLPLKPGLNAVGDNLFRCYERSVRNGIFPEDELNLVRAWLSDLNRCCMVS